MPEQDQACTCLCTGCAEYAGCGACPDCASGCDACGYPHREADLDAGAEERARTIKALASATPEHVAELWNRYGAPKPTPGGPTGFDAGPMLIDDGKPTTPAAIVAEAMADIERNTR